MMGMLRKGRGAESVVWGVRKDSPLCQLQKSSCGRLIALLPQRTGVRVGRFQGIALTAMLAFVLLGGVAHAAAPTKNGIYTWKGTETSKGSKRLLKVELHVALSGKTATAALSCGPDAATLALSSSLKAFPITTKGTFSGQYNQGTLSDVWSLKGQFKGAKAATLVLHMGLYSPCIPGPANYNVTLAS